MTKYKVKVNHVFAEVFDIEAESKEDAKTKVEEIMKKEDFKLQAGYETTFPLVHWQVITEEEFQNLVEKAKEELKQKEKSNIITP